MAGKFDNIFKDNATVTAQPTLQNDGGKFADIFSSPTKIAGTAPKAAPTPTIDKVGNFMASTFPGTTQTEGALIADPFSLKQNVGGKNVDQQVGDIVKGAWDSIVNSFGDAVDGIGAVFDSLDSSKSASQRVGAATTAVAKVGGAAFSPITALFSAAEKAPVMGSVAKLVSLPFSLVGEGASHLTNAGIDAIPDSVLSPQVKDNIKPGIGAIAALGAQMFLGKVIDLAKENLLPSERAATVFRNNLLKENPNIADDVNKVPTHTIKNLIEKHGVEDAKTIIQQSVEVARQKRGLPASTSAVVPDAVPEAPIQTSFQAAHEVPSVVEAPIEGNRFANLFDKQDKSTINLRQHTGTTLSDIVPERSMMDAIVERLTAKAKGKPVQDIIPDIKTITEHPKAFEVVTADKTISLPKSDLPKGTTIEGVQEALGTSEKAQTKSYNVVRQSTKENVETPSRGGTWYATPDSKTFDFSNERTSGGPIKTEKNINLDKPYTIQTESLGDGSGHFFDEVAERKLLPKEYSLYNDLQYAKGTADEGAIQKVRNEIANYVGSSKVSGVQADDILVDKMISKGLREKGYDGLVLEAPKDTHILKFNNEISKEKVAPTEGGSSKVSKAASDINKKIVEQGFDALSPDQQAQFSTIQKANQLKKIGELMTENPDLAKQAAVGLADMPEGVHPQTLFNAVKNKAIEDSDIATLRDLANSPIATERALAAQTLSAAGFNNGLGEADPVEAIQDVQKTRMDALNKRLKGNKGVTDAINESVRNIDASIKKTAPTKASVEAFIKGLQC